MGSSPLGEKPNEGVLRRGVRARIGGWIKTNPTFHGVVIGLLALALVVLAVWRFFELRQVEQHAAEHRAALVQAATKAIAGQESALLRLSALPLGWAVRAALLKDDLASVDVYIQRMSQEHNVTLAAFVGVDGKVRLAGNRKLEGHPAQEALPGVALNQPNATVTGSGKDVQVVVPVMGYDRRLGTVVLGYALPSGPWLEGAAASNGQSGAR